MLVLSYMISISRLFRRAATHSVTSSFMLVLVKEAHEKVMTQSESMTTTRSHVKANGRPQRSNGDYTAAMKALRCEKREGYQSSGGHLRNILVLPI